MKFNHEGHEGAFRHESSKPRIARIPTSLNKLRRTRSTDFNSHRGLRERRATFKVISFNPHLFCEQDTFIALGDIRSELLHLPEGYVCCLKRHAVFEKINTLNHGLRG